MFYKYVLDGIIVKVGTSISIPTECIEITLEEKSHLESVIASKPADTLESVYRLSESGQYVAFARTHEETIAWYVEQVNSGEMTLDEVPDDYRAEVEAHVNPTEPDTEQAVVDSIMQEVSSYGY